MKVCLVDFDGTLTAQDTNQMLIILLLKHRPWRLAAVLGHLLMLKSGQLSADRVQTVKNRCVARLINGLGLAQLDSSLATYTAQCRSMFRRPVVDAINSHAATGTQVLIVTASMQEAVAIAVKGLPAQVIGARFPVIVDRFSGEPPGQTCYGEAKVEAIRKWASARGVEPIFIEAWSDSLSDLPMMRLAQKRFWVCKAAHQSAFRTADPEAELVVVG